MSGAAMVPKGVNLLVYDTIWLSYVYKAYPHSILQERQRESTAPDFALDTAIDDGSVLFPTRVRYVCTNTGWRHRAGHASKGDAMTVPPTPVPRG